jgi:peptidoglycan-associated lipoprotein
MEVVVMKNVALSILMAGLLAACATEKQKEPTKPETPAPAAAAPAPEPAPAPAPTKVEMDPLDDPSSILAKRSVYYPLDVAVVQKEDRAVVEAHAQYLASHPGAKVRVEGNCDERGSNEYNLALGQRRADGVKKMLQTGGASAGQVSASSNGEEKPKATCHAESCWKENRRSDLIYSR